MPITQKMREKALRGLNHLTNEEKELFKSEVVRIVGRYPEGIGTAEIDRGLFPPNGSNQNMRGYQFIAKCRDEGKIKPKPPGNRSPWVVSADSRGVESNQDTSAEVWGGYLAGENEFFKHRQKAEKGIDLLKKSVMDVLAERAKITISDLSAVLGIRINPVKRGVGVDGLTWAVVVLLMNEGKIRMTGRDIYLSR